MPGCEVPPLAALAPAPDAQRPRCRAYALACGLHGLDRPAVRVIPGAVLRALRRRRSRIVEAGDVAVRSAARDHVDAVRREAESLGDRYL